MNKLFKSVLAAVAMAAVPLADAEVASAAPVGGSLMLERASDQLIQQITSHQAASGKKCLKWSRRWNTRHGVGRRRCVHWK